MKNKVELTQEHIDNGKPYICSRCPVALAIRDSIPGADKISVMPFGDWIIRFVVNGTDVSVKTPESVVRFVGRFDARRKVKPFTFELGFLFRANVPKRLRRIAQGI